MPRARAWTSVARTGVGGGAEKGRDGEEDAARHHVGQIAERATDERSGDEPELHGEREPGRRRDRSAPHSALSAGATAEAENHSDMARSSATPIRTSARQRAGDSGTAEAAIPVSLSQAPRRSGEVEDEKLGGSGGREPEGGFLGGGQAVARRQRAWPLTSTSPRSTCTQRCRPSGRARSDRLSGLEQRGVQVDVLADRRSNRRRRSREATRRRRPRPRPPASKRFWS